MFVYFYRSYVLKKVVAVVYCFHLFKQNGSPYQCNLLPLMLATTKLWRDTFSGDPGALPRTIVEKAVLINFSSKPIKSL